MSLLVGVIPGNNRPYKTSGSCPTCWTMFRVRKVRKWPCMSHQDLLKRGLGRFYQPPVHTSDICVCCGRSSWDVLFGLCSDCKKTEQEMGPEAFAKYIEYLSAPDSEAHEKYLDYIGTEVE